MYEILSIIRWPLIVLMGASAVYWLVILFRIRRAVRSVPTVRAGLAMTKPDGGWPRVSLIVPAHNEEKVIEACALRLLAQDYENIEIIFVLDRCTDRTAELLEVIATGDDSLIIVKNDTCPSDWAGKCNAARVGVEHATGEWLLFTDADTEFDPSLVRAAVGLAMNRELGLLSLLSTLSTENMFERIVQPVASMNLMRMFPIDLVNDYSSNREFANGQFMLFSRETYEKIGGHETVKDDLLEDISFARHVKRKEKRSGLFFDDGMLKCEMYDTFTDFREGWKRIYIEACKRKTGRLNKLAVRITIASVFEPLVRAATAYLAVYFLFQGDAVWGYTAGAIVLCGWLFKCITLGWSYRLANAPLWAVLTYPMAGFMVGRIMREGVSDLKNERPVKWGGREYILKQRA